MNGDGKRLELDQHAWPVVEGLRAIGYLGAMLEENYSFPDWFDQQRERLTVAAAFGETPASYESACIGIVRANDVRGHQLVNGYRSLGAPILLEIDGDLLREWKVSRSESGHDLVGSYQIDQIASVLAQRAPDWKPDTLLRVKNIAWFQWDRQLSLFAGLLPELESRIQAELDPLLRRTLAETAQSYREETRREPNPEHLFKLFFWMLTAKVFRDRRVAGFADLSADADVVLATVAKHYKKETPRHLTKQARQIAATVIWDELDFRNLSVDVLSQIWSTTLVDDETKKKLGIHRTPKNIVRYIVERVPLTPAGDDKRIIFEPCCGSAAFLIGAMHVLRRNLYGAPPEERHQYFVNHLAGVELDPFGAEISTLALTLADFPNPNGWDVSTADVFESGAMASHLRRAGVVLCNPPFEDFDLSQRRKYDTVIAQKPVELLNRILDDLHQTAVLGFVLPRVAIDGQSYAGLRERLAKRFASLEFTDLPDKVFEADAEVALMVAAEPIPHDRVRVTYRRVRDDHQSWTSFAQDQAVSVEYSDNVGIQQARESVRIPELCDVWKFLRHNPTLDDVAEIHRGLEWKLRLEPKGRRPGFKSILVLDHAEDGYIEAVPPKANFGVLEAPHTAWLSIKPEHRLYNAWQLDWRKPKVILNKTTRSRRAWRIAAFIDRRGIACYQTFDAVWPTGKGYDEVLLAATLNSPVANAFVWSREGKTDIRVKTLRQVPIPVLTESQRVELHRLVAAYEHIANNAVLTDDAGAELLLKRIDALILDGYRMPADLERQVLDLFNGDARAVRHHFTDYIPADVEPNVSLRDFLDPEIMSANFGALLKSSTQ